MKVRSPAQAQSRCSILAYSLLEFQSGTTSVEPRPICGHSTDTVNPSWYFPLPATIIITCKFPTTKRVSEEKATLSMHPGLSDMERFQAPPELQQLHSSSTSLKAVVQAQPHEFWGTCGTSLRTPTRNHTDPLLSSGTSPALPKSFRSHLTLKMFYYELPSLSFSSLCLEECAFPSRASELTTKPSVRQCQAGACSSPHCWERALLLSMS